MIPGPIEFEPEVLRAMSLTTTSHVAPNFIETFGHCLELLKNIFEAPNGQPFVIAGSGTLAMDMAAANLIETGEKVLVISTGYFGGRFNDIFKRYGASTTVLRASIGESVDLAQIENVLKTDQFKALAMTHVDTSTGILADAQSIAELANKYGALSVLDGVCSVAGERMEQENWGIDIVLTGSQKAIGVPPGLALLMASKRAIEVWKKRKNPVPNYYADWANWLPIMQAYEERRPSYFGTPSVNLIYALEVSLQSIIEEGMVQRAQRHKKLADAFRRGITAIGLKLMPKTEEVAANTLSAIYFPEDIDGGLLRKKIMESDVIIAGGLLPEIKNKYFRVGHMGAVSANDLLAVLGALERVLLELGHCFEAGRSMAVFQDTILNWPESSLA